MNRENFETTAYLVSEELRFEASIVQEAVKEVVSREDGKPSYHYFRGVLNDRLDRCQRLNKAAESILEISEQNSLEDFDKDPLEEIRAEKEKYMNHRRRPSRFTGSLGEAMDAHQENVYQAAVSDKVSYATGYHSLRSAKLDYEKLASNLAHHSLDFENSFIYPLSSESSEAEIIEETIKNTSIEEFDHILGKEF